MDANKMINTISLFNSLMNIQMCIRQEDISAA